MRVGVMGAGLIGGYLGARLAAAGVPVTFVGRPSFIDEVRAHGLRTTDPGGRATSCAAAELQLATEPAALADCDWVLVTLKGAQTPEVARQLKGVLSSRSWVVSFQNGLRAAEVLRGELGDHVLAGMVPFNVVRSGPAAFQQATTGILMVEQRGPVEELVAALNRAGLRTRSDPRIVEIQWGKLLLNLNNAINALCGRPLREELLDRGYRQVLADCIDEGVRLLRRMGVRPRLDKPIPAALVPKILRLPTPLFRAVAGSMVRIDPQARSSMWEDLSRGRKTEVDFLNGEIASRAQAAGVAAPVNAAIVRLIGAAELDGQGSPRLSSEALRRAVGSLG